MSWYTRDSRNAVEANRKAIETEREERTKVPFRVIVKPSEEDRKLIYLDDEGFSFWEHTMNIPGQGWKQLTCLRPNPGCPMCAMGDRPYYVTLFSVVDTKEYKDRQGNVHKNKKKIHALKTEAAGKLFKLKEQCGGLKGRGILTSRGASTEPSSGSMFLVERDAEDKKVQYNIPDNDDWKAFDYADIFKPKAVDQLKAILGLPVGDSNVGGSPRGDFSVGHDAADPIPLAQDEPKASAPVSEAKTAMPTTANDQDVPF